MSFYPAASNSHSLEGAFPSRVPVSRRLLSASIQQEPQFAVLPSASVYQPSRKREEARALQNLRRRVQSLRIVHAEKSGPSQDTNDRTNGNDGEQQDLDNRPQLLHKNNRVKMSIHYESSCGDSVDFIKNQLAPNYNDIKNYVYLDFVPFGKAAILSNRPVSMVLDISDLRTAWQDSDFITDCVCWHNVYRQRHSSPALTMSSELCHLAQTWANHLAHTNRFYYRNDKDIGQNLFCRPSTTLQNDVSGTEVASYWYSAVRQYDYGKEPDVLHANVNAGHFTQLVWAGSKYFGVGKARSRSGKVVVVAHYAPAGNISGAYKYNVLPPVSEYAALPAPAKPRLILSSGSTETDSSENTNTTTSSQGGKR